MIDMSSTFIRLIYNVSYHCPPESLCRSPVFSISDHLPRVSSHDLSCLSNSTLSLLEPDCPLSLLEPDSSLSLLMPDYSLSLLEPASLGTLRRCVPLRTVVACGYAPSLRTFTSRPGTHLRCVRLALSLRTCTSRPGTHRRCVRLRTVVADLSAYGPTAGIQQML